MHLGMREAPSFRSNVHQNFGTALCQSATVVAHPQSMKLGAPSSPRVAAATFCGQGGRRHASRPGLFLISRPPSMPTREQ